jgi:alpha-tubulin suppressor-like RCC1 family protein
LGNNQNQKSPTLLKIEGYDTKNIRKMCAGESHTVFLMEDGKVLVFGKMKKIKNKK